MKLLGISLALVMVLGSVPLGFSEPLRVQLEQGIETEQLQCNNPEHVLVLRTNGNPACVSERTSEKMGWEITSDKKSFSTNVIYDYPIHASNSASNDLLAPQSESGYSYGPMDLSLSNIPNVGETATLTANFTLYSQNATFWEENKVFLSEMINEYIYLGGPIEFVDESNVMGSEPSQKIEKDLPISSVGDNFIWTTTIKATGEGLAYLNYGQVLDSGYEKSSTGFVLKLSETNSMLNDDYIAIHGMPVKSQASVEEGDAWMQQYLKDRLDGIPEKDPFDGKVVVRDAKDVPEDEYRQTLEDSGEYADEEINQIIEETYRMDSRGLSPYSTISFPEKIKLGQPFDVKIGWQWFEGSEGLLERGIYDYERGIINGTTVDVMIDTNAEFINADSKNIRVHLNERTHETYDAQFYEREFDYHPTEVFSEIVTLQFNKWAVSEHGFDGFKALRIDVGDIKYVIHILPFGDSATLSTEYVTKISQNSEDEPKRYYGYETSPR